MKTKVKGIKYQAQAIAAGMMTTTEGHEKPFIRFSTEGGEFVWYGYLGADWGKERAINAAIAAGFCGDGWKDFAEGLKYFKPETFCTITVVDTEYKGKPRKEVKYVNHMGSGKPFESMKSSSVKSDDSGLFKQAKQKLGIKENKPVTDDIPF